jgi:hypothetical protein
LDAAMTDDPRGAKPISESRKLLLAKLRRYIRSMEMHMIKPERFHAPAPIKDDRLADGAFVTELISGQYYKHLYLPNIEFWHVSNLDAPIAVSTSDTMMSVELAAHAIEADYTNAKEKRSAARRPASRGAPKPRRSPVPGAANVTLVHHCDSCVRPGAPACLFGHPMVALDSRNSSNQPCSVCGKETPPVQVSTCSCCIKGPMTNFFPFSDFSVFRLFENP